MRQERSGMVLGTYEQACVPWQPKQHALGASAANCCSPTSTASRPISSSASSTSRRSPRPASSTSSTGPSPSRRTAIRWSARCRACAISGCACGVMAGFSQGGGVGLALSQWMVNGDPGFDVWGMDVRALRRMGDPHLHQREGARELFAPLLDPLPQRGTARRPAAADHRALRHDAGAGRRHGRQLGPGDAAVVRAQGRGAEGHRLLPPLQ